MNIIPVESETLKTIDLDSPAYPYMASATLEWEFLRVQKKLKLPKNTVDFIQLIILLESCYHLVPKIFTWVERQRVMPFLT